MYCVKKLEVAILNAIRGGIEYGRPGYLLEMFE